MYIGYYPDPINKIQIQKKSLKQERVLVVIPVYVGPQARSVYQNFDEDMQRQNNWIDDKLESIKFTLKCHEFFKTAVPYDIVLVNNGTEDEDAIAYYSTTGYRVYNRENEGFSFGAWKWYWENFGRNDIYSHYLFQEADYSPCKDYWLEEIIDEFYKDDQIGAIGNVLETRGIETADAPFEIYTTDNENLINTFLKDIHTHRNWMCNLDGCYTFTSKDILKEVDKYGGLRVLPCTGGNTSERQYSASTNELLFQQPILELGYKIAGFGHQEFSRSDRIYFFGIRNGNLVRDFDSKKLVPIVSGNTRISCHQMGEYFKQLNLI